MAFNRNIPINFEELCCVLCCDEAYVVPCAVTIYSFIISLRECNIPIPNFYVFTDNVSKHGTVLLYSLKKCEVPITIIPLPSNWIPSAMLNTLPESLTHITLTTYARFLIEKYIAHRFKKAIYMDCDMIILKADELLFEVSRVRRIAAALDGASPEERTRLGLGAEDYVFNAGLLLIDLQYWRDERIDERLWECGTKNQILIKCCDQDIINMELSREIVRLPIKFNFHEHYWRTGYATSEIMPQIPTEYHRELQDAFASPIVLHFNTEIKPWSHNSERYPFFIIWQKIFMLWLSEVTKYSKGHIFRQAILKLRSMRDFQHFQGQDSD